ncbi:MAG: RNA 2',3'-cyclic phosphodiesterase [Candidatus Promineifilaceae bacterium]|nr:RNA 2',3'-cyclic phosphodiesterase [Candidatus Promineifilaceae bacterium]
MKPMRAFVAIQLPRSVRNELERVNESLAVQLPRGSVRWVKPERMHLTLRFLGDTVVSKLPPIYAILDQTAAQHQTFALNLHQLGCFPNCKRPRVIWAGIQGQLDAASALKQDLDQALLTLGWEQEQRPFRPHLTLGRVKDSRKLRAVNWNVEVQKLSLPVDSMHLVESKLTPDGPIYTIRHTSRLRS